MEDEPGLLEELKRRKVVRAALVYAAAAFAVLEFADIAFPRLGLPDGLVNTVLWLALAGFPVTIVLAWTFDLRGEAAEEPARAAGWLSFTAVAAAVVLVALGVAAGSWWAGDEGEPVPKRAAPPHRGPSLAVLPFANLSGEAEEYFSQGVAEDIATALARFPGLRVIPPRSAASYADAEAPEIGRALDVRYVIRGSVRRGSDSVRVAARLLDAGTGAQLWAETYDRELSLSDLLEVQDDVADRVVATIADPTGVLSKLGREERGRRGPEHLEAYDCVLQGNAYLQTHTPEVHRRARDCLERAVELDPDYAEAWAHLSYVYREEFQHDYNYGPDPLERALSAGLRAVELDPASPMAHYALSMTYISLGDLDRGRTEAERAFELNPNDTTIVSALAMHLARTGDWERGIDLARKAVALNPEHVGWLHLTLSANEYRQGRYEEALAEVGRWNQPGDTQFHIYRAAALGQLGRRREARAEVDWLLEHDRKFASDPIGELRRYLLSEELTNAYLEGLRKAGLEVPAGG